MNNKYLAKSSLLAAVYVVLTVILGEFSYGPIQFRIAEALVLLPLVEPAAIMGVTVGCIIANIFGGYGPIDIFGGSTVTLIAAYLTSKMPNKILGAIPPIVLNALIVSIWVSKFSGIPYLIIMANIALGETIAVGVLGIFLVSIYAKYIKTTR
ncbi:MAG: QueT transporter family protein [Lutispora sp.]|uniref:QueT transporter family protein n=1 Tax=Lutispora sp. TaxID=2828727 RepID=UPI0035673A93